MVFRIEYELDASVRGCIMGVFMFVCLIVEQD